MAANDAKWRRLYNEAREAGLAAGNKNTPEAMIVQNDQTKQTWYVSEGVCGFAWVNITPGTSSFARWLSKNDLAHKSYYGGVDVWIGDFGQSMDRKSACASAMAEVFREAGIEARSMSRMD